MTTDNKIANRQTIAHYFGVTDEKLAESFYAAELYTDGNSKMDATTELIDKFLIWYNKEVKC